MNQDWSDSQVIGEIGRRLRRERLNQNLTQAGVSERAGIRRATVSAVEGGEDFTLGTLVSILRALDRLSSLDAFLPDPGVSPMQLLQHRGSQRQRAGRRTDHRIIDEKQAWSWDTT